MKKAISLLLVLALMLSLCACGSQKKAFALSQLAFADIYTAYEEIENMSADIYEAWRIGIQHDISSLREVDDLSFLTSNLSLTDDEIYAGLAHIQFLYSDFLEYANLYFWVDIENTEDYVNFLRDCDKYDFSSRQDPNDYCYEPDAIYDFLTMFDDGFSGYVYLVVNAYEAKGTTEKISVLLSAAKDKMKTMSNEYSDYEHYPALKGYYTTAQALFDYCKEPTGSFEQAVTTIESYRNEARDYYYDLEYIFVE